MTLRSVPDVPAPVGANHAYQWTWDDEVTPLYRSLDIASWDVEDDEIAVDRSGVHYADGSIRVETLVHLPQRPLTIDEARRLGTALLAAAVAGDKWTTSQRGD